MTRRSTVLALMLLSVLAGCASAPSAPGSGWQEVASPHFLVRTNLDADQARAAAEDLERYRAALLAYWKHPELSGPRAQVVIYADPSQFRERGARDYAGFFRLLRGHELMVESRGDFTEAGLGLAKTNAHELAHEINAAILLRQPRWLAEGLATYLSTVTLEDGKAIFGRGQIDFIQSAHAYKPLTVDELFGWDGMNDGKMGDGQLSRYYVWSWAWVTYLQNERGAQFDDFLARLARAEEPRRAFDAAFGKLDDAKIAVAVQGMLSGMLPTHEVPLPPVAPVTTVRPLSHAEVHTLEANVWVHAPGSWTDAQDEAFARGELAQALASEPQNPEALAAATQVGPEAERISHARALTQLQPKNGDAWLLLAEALGTSLDAQDERGHAFAQALANAGDDPYVLTAVAFHLMDGNPKLALELSSRAAQAQPYVVNNVLALAYAEAANGRCDAAKRDAARALDLYPEGGSRTGRNALANHLNDVLSACKPTDAK